MCRPCRMKNDLRNAHMLEAPIYLTLPDLTKSSNACIVSSMGVSLSNRWICNKSMYSKSNLFRLASTALKIAFLDRPPWLT